jgi:hypothetical protein
MLCFLLIDEAIRLAESLYRYSQQERHQRAV